MQPLEAKVASFIQAHGLFADAGHVLLATSGGADSMALLGAMHTLRCRKIIETDLICAHVNHQLRGVRSDDDQAFVSEQAARFELPITVRTLDVRAHAKTHKLSVETAGRDLRLACLSEIARNHDCSWIATGHQKNDNAETIVQRLTRGTGYRGLAGIWPWRRWGNGPRFARPLLDCTRDEITAYLRTRGLQWREDQTNTDCAYRRNFIRHRLLPALESQGGHCLVEPLADLATSAQRLHRRIVAQTQDAAVRLVECNASEVIIEAAELANLPRPVAIELIHMQLANLGCGQRNLTQRHYRVILQLSQPQTTRGGLTLPNGFFARRQGGKVILQKPPGLSQARIPGQSVLVRVPGTTHYGPYHIEAAILERTQIADVKIGTDKGPLMEYLDLDCVELPLRVRPRHEGDRFHPLGLSGTKKVGKFLTAAKVSGNRRENVMVFHDRRNIVWLCPVRLDERVKVTTATRRLLKLNVVDLESQGAD